VQYLVTQEYVDPGPLLPPEQLVGIMRMAILPGHEAMENLRSEGKILAGGFPVGERAIAFIVQRQFGSGFSADSQHRQRLKRAGRRDHRWYRSHHTLRR
jgi:hypothetical protein